MGKILYVGREAQLLNSRKLALEETGAQVVLARAEQALRQLEGEFFDVVVLCHSLTVSDRARLCRLIELFWPVTRVVQVEAALDMGPGAGPGAARQPGGEAAAPELKELVDLTVRLLEDSAARRQKEPVIFPVGRQTRTVSTVKSLHN